MKRTSKLMMSKLYLIAEESKVGARIKCPACSRELTKKSYQHKFCGTKCKDRYWNRVDPRKRNNTTRISPASRAYMAKMETIREERFNPDDYEHPFSSEALGQWND